MRDEMRKREKLSEEELERRFYDRILREADLSREMEDEELQELIHSVLLKGNPEEFLPLEEKIRLSRELFNAFRKLDLLQELLEDEDITEIMINGTHGIFVEKEGRIYPSERRFVSKSKLEDVIQQMVSTANRYVNESSPIADARLADGSRVNVVMAPTALDGPIVTIRKFPKERITMEKLLELGKFG